MADIDVESRLARLEADSALYRRTIFSDKDTEAYGLLKENIMLKERIEVLEDENKAEKSWRKGILVGLSLTGAGLFTVLSKLFGGG